MKKRIVSMLLVLAMVIGLLPLAAFAAGSQEVVHLSVSMDGTYKTASVGSVMAHAAVPMSALETIDLDAYGMSEYKYDSDGDGNYDITALHLFIYTHEKLYGGAWSQVSASGSPGSLYFGGGLWGFTENMTYYHNGLYPLDPVLSQDWGFDVGATADRCVLKAGDYVDLAGYSDYGFYFDPSAGFRYFLQGERITHSYTAAMGQALTVSLGRAVQSWDSSSRLVQTVEAEAGETVCYSQTLLDAQAKTVTTDESGKVSITFDKVGTWYVWSQGDSVSSPAVATVSVLWNNTTEVTSDWHNFRNSYDNMAIVHANTPRSADTAVLKWAAKLGQGWSAAPSVQIIVDNALIVMSGTTLYKLDLQTGETLATGSMSAAPNFGYTPPSYGDGLIFCPLANGTVEAFNAKTLESVWIYQDVLGGQSLSPITYNDDYVYTGFWNGENKDANYVCINVADGSLVWSKTVTGGFYWAGSVVVGDTLIVGTDDGASGASGDSHLLSMNKKDGSVISDITLTGCGDQRSSIAYHEANNRVYFSTKNGYLCSAALNSSTGEVSDLKSVRQVTSQSTSTPVVFGDKVFYTAGSGVVTGSGGSGNFIVTNADTLEQLYAIPLTAYPQGSTLISDAYYAEEGKLYAYSTYNGYPGGLTLIKIDPTKDTADGAELIELYDAKGYEQYCITSPICGPDGTIYYKNDSGNVLAVTTNNAYLTGLTADVGAQCGAFAASNADIEWVVPVGTTGVTFNPVGCEGATVTVNGCAPDARIILTDGTAAATVVVTKDRDQRVYTVSIREISTDATLGTLKVNESNGYSGFKTLSPEFNADTRFYGYYAVSASKSFVNVWPEAANANASVKVFALKNVSRGDELTGEIEITATSSNHDRYAIYFTDDTKAMAVRIEVTAENGDISNYYLVLSKAASAENGAALLEQIKQDIANQAAADTVIAAINAIETVTLDSEAVIKAARTAYDALTDAQKALVSNYDTLTAAEASLKQLQDMAAQAAADKAAADAVTKKLNAIGTVTLTSEEAIKAARAAYNALTDAQKTLVTNYEVLTTAEASLKQLQDMAAQAAADKAAADAVSAKLGAIGTVTLASEEAIKAARAAYDALTDAQKTLVTNYEVLTAAEDALAKLKAEASTEPETPQTGETAHLELLPAVMVISLCSVIALIVIPRKKLT